MKYIRLFITVVVLLAALGLSGWYLAGWMVSHAFKSASQKGAFQQLSNVVEASVGSTLARGDVRLQLEEMQRDGALPYYQKHPGELQRGKGYFETWSSALAVAHAALKNEHPMDTWQSSTSVDWIPYSQRTDAWGHAFCIQANEQDAVVVSSGPQTLAPLDCSKLKLSQDQLITMHQGRLNAHRSGALILYVKR